MGAHTLPAPTMFITIVPDYRLIDLGVQLPATAQDVQDAMQQVIPCHSAEAINMFAILDLPEFHSTALHPGIKRAVLLSERCMWPADMKLSYAEAKQKIGPLALLDSVILSPRLEGYRQEGYLEKFGKVLGAMTSPYARFPPSHLSSSLGMLRPSGGACKRCWIWRVYQIRGSC